MSAFLTFEGIDGSGKSTQARLLAEALGAAGRDVVLTREPGGSPGAEEIRRLLVEGDPDRWSPETEILLFTAARRDHLEKTIRPALDRGAVVICDRFADSTRVYQGAARGDLRAVVDQLHALMIATEPDLTFILDVDPAAALSRGLARALGRGPVRGHGRGVPAPPARRLPGAGAPPPGAVPADRRQPRPRGDRRRGPGPGRAGDRHDRACRHPRTRRHRRRPAPAPRRPRLRPVRRRGGVPRRLRLGPAAPRLADQPARAAPARRRWPGGWRRSCWTSRRAAGLFGAPAVARHRLPTARCATASRRWPNRGWRWSAAAGTTRPNG